MYLSEGSCQNGRCTVEPCKSYKPLGNEVVHKSEMFITLNSSNCIIDLQIDHAYMKTMKSVECVLVDTEGSFYTLTRRSLVVPLTLSMHAPESYSRHFVC